MAVNRQITLAGRPSGTPSEDDFRLLETEMPTPGSGECLVQGLYLSVDPYMRGRMRDSKSYAAPVALGSVMVGGVVGRVVESNGDRLRSGDIVEGHLGWQEYAVAAEKDLRKIDPDLAPISTALGVLGMPGLTAYFGLLDLCDPQPGETVLVSGAAGAVGSIVGQIAKIRGCRPVGIAGSDEKVALLRSEFGFDAGFNYKTAGDYRAAIAETCPSGVDCYFDNVGGELTDAVIPQLNIHARVSVCGQISQYNLERPATGPRWLFNLVVKRARVQGFLVFDFAERYGEGLRQLGEWVRDGKIRYRETVVEGLENAPQAFIGMLGGKNIGKQIVKLA